MAGLLQEMRRVVTTVTGDEQQASAIVFALISNFGGQQLYMPHNDYKKRNLEMIRLHRAGATVEQLASRYRLAAKTVYSIVVRSERKMINSRKISDLHPKVAYMAKAFIDACAEQHIEILVTSTFRDAESQDALYAQGRTQPGNIVTHAKAGQSWHNYRCAFDFVPIVHGKAQWDDPALFEKCGQIAESAGLEWAGRWVSMKECCHCQYTHGLTLADLRSGKKIV